FERLPFFESVDGEVAGKQGLLQTIPMWHSAPWKKRRNYLGKLQVIHRIFPTRNRKYLIYIFPGRFLTWRNIESLATLAVHNQNKLSRLEP
ncbi:hypothetical protein, partial [Pseudomonas aeruginosa]|uniref:hypothetical protein n=1 Tax=Pseudomonas aeruginosa TaxID=287 RepID=UPI001C108035